MIGPYKTFTAGTRIGRLTVLGDCKPTPYGYSWLCRCSCGTVKWFVGSKLRKGYSKSCGCGWRAVRHHIEPGTSFGWLTTTGKSRSAKYGFEWECKCVCGATVWRRRYKRCAGHTKSCGCYRDHCRRVAVGPLGNNYDPSITDEQRELRRRTRAEADRKWNAVRIQVFTRDGFKCVCCGLSNTDTLHGHHLCGWKHHPELRYVAENCVTVCGVCHRKFHQQYGKENKATPEAFREFVRINNATKNNAPRESFAIET